MNKIKVLVQKEWREVFKNRMVLFVVAFLPILFTILPLGILYSMGTADGGMDALSDMDLGGQFTQFCGGLTSSDCGQYYLLAQFMMFFMMMPVIIPVTISSYSIVGEKSMRTLEPLLATPITTIELLIGKALAAIIPAISVNWLGFGLYLLGIRLLNVSPAAIKELLNPIWLMTVLVLGPLLSVTSVSMAVMISSRVNDPRVAEQLASLLVLPVVGLAIGQTTGLFFINQTMIVWLSVGVALVDVLMVYFAVQLFQRESILTRWK